MQDTELMELSTRIMRKVRDGEVLDFCVEVQRRLVGGLLPFTEKSAKVKRASRAIYMRGYRAKKRNPFL